MLISQMLSDADVLPSAGEGSAVTAVPIEIRFRPRPADFTAAAPGTVPQYWAEFELFSIKEFAEMRDQNIRALLDYWEMVEETASQIPARKPPQEDHARVALHAHDWLEAVYGTNTFKGAQAAKCAVRHFPFCSAFIEKYRLQMLICSLGLTARRKQQRLTKDIGGHAHKVLVAEINATKVFMTHPLVHG